MLVPLWHHCALDVSTYLADECPSLSGCAVAGSTRYLGVEVGPEAHAVQWAAVCQKLLRRMADIVAGGESLGVRLRRFVVYAATLPTFRCQFADIDSSLNHVRHKCLQRLTSAPWQIISAPILRGLRLLDLGGHADDLQHLADACRFRRVASSRIFDRFLQQVREASLHADALWCTRIGTGRNMVFWRARSGSGIRPSLFQGFRTLW